MKTKFNGLWIKRTHNVSEVDKHGNEKIVKKKADFPCRISAAIPLNHRMYAEEK